MPDESSADDSGTAGVDAEADRVDADPDGADADVARREKSFRGISQRLAVHYLTNLGGEEANDETGADDEAPEAEADDETADEVVGDGWRATLSSETVGVGPSLDLTEVTIAFEGDAETLDPLVERFSQKAMRAGG
nr:hypothetical protein [Halegenticoccus tardaugens]